MNGVLLGASVLTILGIYGFSIYQSSTGGEELVLTPPRPAEAVAPPPTADDPDASPAIDGAGWPDTDPIEPSADPAPPMTGVDADESVAQAETDPDVAETSKPEIAAQDDDVRPDAPVETAVVDEKEFLASGWKVEASRVLQGFLSASNHEEQIRFLNDADRVAPLLNALHQQGIKPWDGLSVDEFNHVDLSEADRRRGMFLMLRETPEENPADRYYAFFKLSDEGLKLDLEVFLQTTGKSFRNFVEQARPGTSRVFRVFITEDPSSAIQSGANFRTYIVTDLANFDSPARIRVTNISPIGRILSEANFKSDDGTRQVMRNATVELRWIDHPENSVIELSRFFCWEFLGLGGEPIDDPAVPQW